MYFISSILLPFCLLSIAWYTLSGIYNPHILGLGAISILLTLALLRFLSFLPRVYVSKRGMLYIPRLLYEICLSSITTTKYIWSNRISYEPRHEIVSFKNLSNTITATMHAAAITMTPGTIVVGLDDNQMLIHRFNGKDCSTAPSDIIAKIIDES